MSSDAPTLWRDRYAPVTSSIGFVAAPLNEVAAELQRWRAEIHGRAECVSLAGGFADNVHVLEPLTGGVRPRELLVGTASAEWTALFDCGVQGGDQVTTVAVLARRMQHPGLAVASIPDVRAGRTGVDRFGALQFEMFGPLQTSLLNSVRSVSLVRDGARWRFDADGTVQAFEDTAAYGNRRVGDRLTGAMLSEYCRALGVDAFAEQFYCGPSVLVTNPAVPPPDGWVLTIDEARRRYGIDASTSP